MHRITVTAIAALGLVLAPQGTHAQEAPPASLGGLIAEAHRTSPEIAAARMGVEAASARIAPAGALPDPMLSVGLQNLPLPELDLGMEGMTMGMLQLGQRFTAPGVRAARTAQAEAGHRAAEHRLREVGQAVEARLKRAYYDVYFLDRSLDVLASNRALLEDLAEVAATRYAVGRVPQADVLRAQTEITRLDEQRAGIEATRAARMAEVGSLIGAPSGSTFSAVVPPPVRQLATAPGEVALFASPALDQQIVPGIPPLDVLLERSAARPAVAAARAEEEAATAAVDLARREAVPGVEVMLGLGARRDRPTLATAMVSVPLPVWTGRKQVPRVREAEAMEAQSGARVAAALEVSRATVATRYAELARTREQIMLLTEGVIPQADATFESALTAYQAGSVGFIALLEAQAALYRYEIELARRLADFGQALASLEEEVGERLVEISNDPQEG